MTEKAQLKRDPSSNAAIAAVISDTWHSPSDEWEADENYNVGMVVPAVVAHPTTTTTPAPAGMCDLCYTRPTRNPTSLLCHGCAAVVARVVNIAHYEATRGVDKTRNNSQVQLLIAYQTHLAKHGGASAALIAEAILASNTDEANYIEAL